MQTTPCHLVMHFDSGAVTGTGLPGIDADAVLAAADAAGWVPGGLKRAASSVPEAYFRKCQLSHGIAPQLLARLESQVTSLARSAFGFDVDGMRDYDPAYVIRYEVGDHFGWHVDNGILEPPSGSRKLSFTLQLSRPGDYEGGDLEFALYASAYGGDSAGMKALLRRRGSLIVFPSLMLHRVSPVTRGARYALVGWVHGPAFR